MMDPDWLAFEVHANGQFRIGRLGEELVADWSGVGRLVASRDGSTWRFEASPHADPELVQKLACGSIPSLLRHLRGELALHGSAVAGKGGAVVFLGRSGRGKSTLAEWLCRSDSATFFADDATAVRPAQGGGWLVEPQERHHYLCVSGRPKLRIPASHPGVTPVRLRALVELVFAPVAQPSLAALHGIEAFAVLVPSVVRFALDEPPRHKEELHTLAQLVETVPVMRLTRPHDLEALADTSTLLEPWLERP